MITKIDPMRLGINAYWGSKHDLQAIIDTSRARIANS